MILGCGMCGGVIELAAAGGVLGLSAMLTQLWNRRMRFKTLFSDMRRRHELAVAMNPAARPVLDAQTRIESLDRDAFMDPSLGQPFDRPQPPKWLASFVVIASIVAFFALMWAVDPHHGFAYQAAQQHAAR